MKLKAMERRVLNKLDHFSVWGTGRDGRNFVNELSEENRKKVVCFGDVDVKKVCYTAAKTLMFEQNSEMLWTQFKSKIMPTLDRMTTGHGLSGYKIVRLPSNDKTKLKAQIILYPVYAVEKFDITIVMTNEDLAVTDGN